MRRALVFVVIALVAGGRGSPLEKVSEETAAPRTMDNELHPTAPSEDTLLRKLNVKCSQRDTVSCVMLKLVTYMNRLLKKSNIEITDSMVISQTSQIVEPQQSPLARSLKSANDASEDDLVGQLVAEKLWGFVQSRSLKWNILPEADLVVSATPDQEGTLNLGMSIRAGRALQETGRGKMKNLGPLFAAGMMKIGMVGVLAFKALALLVGKALLVSKLAFLLAAVIGLKKLFSQQKHVTYEVVTHPHHSHSHTSDAHSGHADTYSSGWGRSLPIPVNPQASGDPQTLAYSAHTTAQ